MKLFSLAICTYNRDAHLDSALRSLAECLMPEQDWELLVIDNNSTDQTRTVAESHRDRLPLRYVFESRQGLSHARNRAIGECRGEWLVFTDDDVMFDTQWLVAYSTAMRAYPDAGYLGGRIIPWWPAGRPAWLKDENLSLIAGLLVRYDRGIQTRPYTPGEPTPFGASFGLRRSVFETTTGFRPDLGVSGTTPGRGEEAEYLGRVVRAGRQGIYVGEATARHWTDANRLTLPYLYRYGVQKGIAARRMGGGPAQQAGRRISSYAVRGLWQLIKGRGDRFRQCVINIGIVRGMMTEPAAGQGP